jgi:hypothetical protein
MIPYKCFGGNRNTMDGSTLSIASTYIGPKNSSKDGKRFSFKIPF